MPASPYVICLDDAPRAELEAVSRRATAPFRLVQRARIVLLAAGGLGSPARQPPPASSPGTRTAPSRAVGYDVHRAKVTGRCEPATGIKPFTALVGQVMN